MKKLNFLIIFLLALAPASQAAPVDSVLLARVKEIASEIRKKYAPDKRTEIFDVEADAVKSDVLTVESTKDAAIKSFREELGRQNIKVQVQENLLPSKELDGMIYGVANLSVCNNRKEPAHSAEMVTQMILGTPVEVLKKHRGYYLVRTPDRYISWVDNHEVEPMNEAAFKSWQASPKIVITSGYTHSFQQAKIKSGPVSDLVAGNILKVEGTKKKFYKVAFPDGRKAFVLKKEAARYDKWAARPDPTAGDILATAKTLVGVPYLWGGTSIKWVDCSGFTKTCYFLNGIVLPRDASQQALVGEKVDIYEGDTVNLAKCLKNLQPGDLLFFAGGKGKSLNARVTHTAIYMGNGQFIQSAGLVRINSMDPSAGNFDDYQSRTLVGARRMLTSVGTPEVTRVDKNPFYISIPNN